MKFFVLPQRQEGRLRPRWQLGPARRVFGNLQVIEARDRCLNRTILVAHVKHSQTFEDLLPPLKDVRLLYMNNETVVITGFEEDLDRDLAQTWMLASDEKSLHALHWPTKD